MDNNGLQTSFIPKKPISSVTASYENRGVSIVTIIAVIVFFGSVALSVGTYLYKGILKKQLQSKVEDLEKAREGFDLETVNDLQRLDTRIESVKKLLERHIATSAYFGLLEDATLKSIKFSDLSIKSSNQNTSGPTVDVNIERPLEFSLSGTAKSYSAVAIQSDVFTKAKGFREPIFSNLTLDDKGNINFKVEALIDPQYLRYRSTLSGIPAPTNNQTSSSTEQ